ncbi:MAG: hypothetical protein R2828_35570 [Saprospiraceae bacterium]
MNKVLKEGMPDLGIFQVLKCFVLKKLLLSLSAANNFPALYYAQHQAGLAAVGLTRMLGHKICFSTFSREKVEPKPPPDAYSAFGRRSHLGLSFGRRSRLMAESLSAESFFVLKKPGLGH